MKAFFNEYGQIVVSAIVVILLITMITPVGGSIKNSVTDLISKFAGTSGHLTNSIDVTLLDSSEEATLPAGLYDADWNLLQELTIAEVEADHDWSNYPSSINDNYRNAIYAIIPQGTTKIGKEIFESCSSLKSVRIPDSVSYISQSAFEYCFNLETVYMSGNVLTIVDAAFHMCGIGTEKGRVTIYTIFGEKPNGWYNLEEYDAYVVWTQYEIIDGDKNGKHYHNDALFTGYCGDRKFEDGLEISHKLVGYYADTNNNGVLDDSDGVIFFDYEYGVEAYSGTGESFFNKPAGYYDSSYYNAHDAVAAKTAGLADYILIGDNLVQKVGPGADRFYVIDRANTQTLTIHGGIQSYGSWRYSLGLGSATSTAFGSGKTNTADMLAIWEIDNNKDEWDIWNYIPDGKFILSKEEWSVLGSELKKVSTGTYSSITTNAGATISFSDDNYFSSSREGEGIWCTDFEYDRLTSGAYFYNHMLRLAQTY